MTLQKLKKHKVIYKLQYEKLHRDSICIKAFAIKRKYDALGYIGDSKWSTWRETQMKSAKEKRKGSGW